MPPGRARFSKRWLRARGCVLSVMAVGMLTFCAQVPPAPVSSVPSASWGVYKSCGPSDPAGNCASVRAIRSVGPAVYLGGDFTHLIEPVTGVRIVAKNLAALGGNGAPLPGFRTHDINGSVLALAVDHTRGRLLVAGTFTQVDGAPAGHLAAFTTTTGERQAFGGVPGTARALLLASSRLYVGTDQVNVLDPATGAPAGSWSARAAADDGRPTINSLAAAHGRIYVGGHFDAFGGLPRSTVAAASPAGVVDAGFAPSIVRLPGDPLQVGLEVLPVEGAQPGVLLAAAGVHNRVYRFNLDGTTAWQNTPDGDPQALARIGETVFVGGHFQCWHTASGCIRRIHVAAVGYQNGVLDPSWAPELGPTPPPYFLGVWALHAVGPDLWAGGVFIRSTSGGTALSRPKVAVFRS